MKIYLPAFLTNPISANTCWQISQQKHSGCQLLFIALITRPIMNSPVRNTTPGCKITHQTKSAHNRTARMTASPSSSPPKSGRIHCFQYHSSGSKLWNLGLCGVFCYGSEENVVLMEDLLFFTDKPF